MGQEPVVGWLAVSLLPLYGAVGYLLWRARRRSAPPVQAPSTATLTPAALRVERDRVRERLRDMPGYATLSPREQAHVEERIIRQGAKLLGAARR